MHSFSSHKRSNCVKPTKMLIRSVRGIVRTGVKIRSELGRKIRFTFLAVKRQLRQMNPEAVVIWCRKSLFDSRPIRPVLLDLETKARVAFLWLTGWRGITSKSCTMEIRSLRFPASFSPSLNTFLHYVNPLVALSSRLGCSRRSSNRSIRICRSDRHRGDCFGRRNRRRLRSYPTSLCDELGAVS